jgi:low affinity Fe/Cu permease
MNSYNDFLESFTHRFVKWTGTSWGFTVAFGICIALVVSGGFLPQMVWGDTITAVTGLGSFLMIFLMQRSQNKDFMALQVKLNELLKAHEQADSGKINIETTSEEHIKAIHDEDDSLT